MSVQKQIQLKWRPMTESDLDYVEDIGKIVHPNVPESIDVYYNRLKLCPDGSFILENNGKPLGYAVVHPWRMHTAPEINQIVDELPDVSKDSDACLFFHDFALLPDARGHGAPTTLVNNLFAMAKARGYKAIGLVSINGSSGYWNRYGFEKVHAEPGSELDLILDTYCPDAIYMVCHLDQQEQEKDTQLKYNKQKQQKPALKTKQKEAVKLSYNSKKSSIYSSSSSSNATLKTTLPTLKITKTTSTTID